MRRFAMMASMIGSFWWGGAALAAADCQKSGEVCVAPHQTRLIGGVSVQRDCWEYRATYQCRSKQYSNDCQPLKDRGCAQIGSVCIDLLSNGSCQTFEQRFQCLDQPSRTEQHTRCQTASFCPSGDACFATASVPDADMGKVAAMIETAREAGAYGPGPNSTEVFKGFAEECSIKGIGGTTLNNCCRAKSGGDRLTNKALLGAGVAGAVGSPYVFDSLFQLTDSSVLQHGVAAAGDWAVLLGNGSVDSLFSTFGFTFEFSLANGLQITAFDPVSFGVAIGLMLIEPMLSCSNKESLVSLQRGQGLCVHTDTYCSQRVLGVCVERKERHCCFNSKLAKLINRQGRAQLGLPLNSCSGFTQAQLQQLDFAKMDLTEFMADVKPKQVDTTQMTGKATSTVTQKIKDYYGQ
jgi:conjugal transfer mating pair stabilization protein TraN